MPKLPLTAQEIEEYREEIEAVGLVWYLHRFEIGDLPREAQQALLWELLVDAGIVAEEERG